MKKLLLVVVVFFGFLQSCSKNNNIENKVNNPLIGEWQQIEIGYEIKDGSIVNSLLQEDIKDIKKFDKDVKSKIKKGTNMSLVFDNNKRYKKDNFETDYGLKSRILQECSYKIDTATNIKSKKIDNLIYFKDNKYGYDYPDIYSINNDTLTILFHQLNYPLDKSAQSKRKYLKIK